VTWFGWCHNIQLTFTELYLFLTNSTVTSTAISKCETDETKTNVMAATHWLSQWSVMWPSIVQFPMKSLRVTNISKMASGNNCSNVVFALE